MTPYADLQQRLPSHARAWGDPAFADELVAWAGEQVGPIRAMEQVKLRVWAAVWAVETETHRYYLKQNCELQAFEAALVAELAALVPDRVVPVVAVDAGRGLLLTPDQGQVLGDSTADDDLDLWGRVVAAGAALQREVASASASLAGCGLTAIPPEEAAAYLARRVDELGALPEGDPRRLPADDAAALRAHLPVVRAWAEQVAALGLPVTLNHNDLHENNVFRVGEELRFFDFADALLTEPLGALLIPLNMLAGRLEAGPDDPRLRRVADAALEVWSDLAPAAELRAALPAALQLARLGRVESWARCCASMTPEELAEWGDTVPRWMATLLADPPVGHLRP